MVGREEAQRQLEPILGDAPVDARIDLADLDPEPLLEPLHLLLAEPASVSACFRRGLEQDLLGAPEILVEMHRQPDLVPDVREFVRVIVDRLSRTPCRW